MKIAILIPSYSKLYGIERVVTDQARNFAIQGNKVTILALKGGVKPPANVELKIIGTPQTFVLEEAYRLLFPLNFIKTFEWVPQLMDCDVIYSHDYPMHWLAYMAKKKYGIEYVYYHHHFNPPQSFPTLIERMYIRLKFPVQKWLIKKADRAISISEFSSNQLRNETGLESEIIYDIIDTRRFHKGIDGKMIREQYCLANYPIILYAGRITSTKGLHLLIEAFNLVKLQIIDARLLIVGIRGSTNYFRKLEQMANNSVIFTGYVSDAELPYYYAAADVCATASLAEGFNLFLVEAQECGKPIVAFDIGPHSELLNKEKMVMLVPSGNIQAMADAIIDFLGTRTEHREEQRI